MSSSGERLRFFLGAFGEPGHAFPMLALGAKLASRGHEVAFETWTRWRDQVEAAEMQFVAAPEHETFPTRRRPIKPYQAVVQAAGQTREQVARCSPDLVVHDILTLAPALAGELEAIPVATLVPHVYPATPPGFAPYALGATPPRTPFSRWMWLALHGPIQAGLRQGREQLNTTRRKLGLPPVNRLLGGISDLLCMVGTFPALEYPRQWPASVEVVGPVMWEPPSEEVEPPPGADPLVLVATSTAQDPEHRLLRVALEALADEPVRVLATWNRRPLREPVRLAANSRLVEWLSYSRTMPRCALVICHAGHGTMARALASGCPVLAVPHSGDMAENAARAEWAGVGVRMPWRFLTPRALRVAVRRALADGALASRARELSRWAAMHDGAERAAELAEGLALSRRGASERIR